MEVQHIHNFTRQFFKHTCRRSTCFSSFWILGTPRNETHSQTRSWFLIPSSLLAFLRRRENGCAAHTQFHQAILEARQQTKHMLQFILDFRDAKERKCMDGFKHRRRFMPCFENAEERRHISRFEHRFNNCILCFRNAEERRHIPRFKYRFNYSILCFENTKERTHIPRFQYCFSHPRVCPVF